jgi:hypothetical protein
MDTDSGMGTGIVTNMDLCTDRTRKIKGHSHGLGHGFGHGNGLGHGQRNGLGHGHRTKDDTSLELIQVR